MNHTPVSAEAVNAAFHKFCNSLTPELKEHLNGRLERGLQLALSGGVKPCGTAAQIQYLVNSSDPSHPPYFVDLTARTCTCPDHWKGHYCKHRVAAQVYRLACSMAPAQKVGVPEPISPPPSVQPPSDTAGKALIWACLRLDGKAIGVEVLGFEQDHVWVQALPVVKENGKLEPQFPFPDNRCSQLVPASELEHIHVYQNA
mgnify:CR=1 FL=1